MHIRYCCTAPKEASIQRFDVHTKYTHTFHPPCSPFFVIVEPKHQVPEEIAALSELRVLALDNNEIKTVPTSIGKLLRLQSLLLRCVRASVRD